MRSTARWRLGMGVQYNTRNLHSEGPVGEHSRTIQIKELEKRKKKKKKKKTENCDIAACFDTSQVIITAPFTTPSLPLPLSTRRSCTIGPPRAPRRAATQRSTSWNCLCPMATRWCPSRFRQPSGSGRPAAYQHRLSTHISISIHLLVKAEVSSHSTAQPPVEARADRRSPPTRTTWTGRCWAAGSPGTRRRPTGSRRRQTAS